MRWPVALGAWTAGTMVDNKPRSRLGRDWQITVVEQPALLPARLPVPAVRLLMRNGGQYCEGYQREAWLEQGRRPRFGAVHLCGRDERRRPAGLRRAGPRIGDGQERRWDLLAAGRPVGGASRWQPEGHRTFAPGALVAVGVIVDVSGAVHRG
jgi:hypothetical protein